MKHVSHIWRRCILMALVLSLATGIMCVASAAEIGRTDDGVELIAPDVMPLEPQLSKGDVKLKILLEVRWKNAFGVGPL